MSSYDTAVLQGTNTYDECLISACLKKMFTRTKAKEDPGFIVRNHIAEVRKELERVNEDDILEMSYDYLAAMERSIPGDGFRYLVIYKQNVPVLFGYFQLFSLTSKNFSFEKNRSFVKSIFRFFLRLKSIRVLITGNALRCDTQSYCFNESALSKEEAAEIMVSAAEKIADDEHTTALIIKDIPATVDIAEWLTGIGYQSPWKDHVMQMDIDPQWTSLADYVAALSRKYKTRASKILTAAAGIQSRPMPLDEIIKREPLINALFNKVSEGQPFKLIKPLDDHFSQLKKVYGDSFEIVGMFHGQQLLGFYSAFITDDAYELYYVGFDYKHNNDYQLYFNILFSGLEQAIALRKRHLKLGRTSFDAKASLGAKAKDTGYFIKIANLPDAVIRWFANYFSSMEDAKWKLRNPLKEAL